MTVMARELVARVRGRKEGQGGGEGFGPVRSDVVRIEVARLKRATYL